MNHNGGKTKTAHMFWIIVTWMYNDKNNDNIYLIIVDIPIIVIEVRVEVTDVALMFPSFVIYTHEDV